MVEELLFQVEEGDGARGREGGSVQRKWERAIKAPVPFSFLFFFWPRIDYRG